MKNIEKYTKTKDALEAYNSLRLKMFPFEEWIELEYEDPSKQTLLEAAEGLINVWEVHGPRHAAIIKKLLDLADAVAREKNKPVLNCDKYRTAKEAFIAFNKMCADKSCYRCPFSAERNGYFSCRLNWLYSESKKEVSK